MEPLLSFFVCFVLTIFTAVVQEMLLLLQKRNFIRLPISVNKCWWQEEDHVVRNGTNTVSLFQQHKYVQATDLPPPLPNSLFLFSSSSTYTKTSWSLAKHSSSAGIPCQQFTRPHPVWSNKETRAISCLSYCQPPPSAHLLTFPSFGVTRKREPQTWEGLTRGEGNSGTEQGSLRVLSFSWLKLLFLL